MSSALIIIIIISLVVMIPSGIASMMYLYYNFVKKGVRKLEEFEKVGDKINKAINKSTLNSKERFYLIIYILQAFALQEDDVRTKNIDKLIELKLEGKELSLGEQLLILTDELKALLEIYYK